MPNPVSVLALVARELLSAPRLARRPEPSATMDDAANVEAFHAQGRADGPLLPVYHFNARAISQLVPEGGTLMDLGSGSGQFLGYLARCRPDMRIIGLDLSAGMIEVGQRSLDAQQLGERVELRLGDMTDFLREIPPKLHCISTVFALHHLPTEQHLKACLAQVAGARASSKCAVWIFDHARPNHPRTPEIFPAIFTPDSAREFQQDSCNSLIASWRFEELSRAVDEALGAGADHHCSKLMRLYQCHRLAAHGSDGKRPWQGETLIGRSAADYRALAGIFPASLQGD